MMVINEDDEAGRKFRLRLALITNAFMRDVENILAQAVDEFHVGNDKAFLDAVMTRIFGDRYLATRD